MLPFDPCPSPLSHDGGQRDYHHRGGEGCVSRSGIGVKVNLNIELSRGHPNTRPSSVLAVTPLSYLDDSYLVLVYCLCSEIETVAT